ncbi:translocation protein S66 [Tulasnella sp. 330]|nr:translocation protein S66 [Tulasnella sp. 330]KAG8877760.1 translocation protein S66 [Tulasnella sp. 331]KAG8878852.1 translocation protein S66 [Tulasnella sp. 332]
MASIPLLVPLTYITLLIGALYTFSKVYRKRTVARIAKLERWFPAHPERDTYISLLQLSPPPSEVLLKAALLRRAAADVQRIISLRDDKTALQALLQKGSIDDDLWNAFTAAEKELEAEIVEVVNEANSFREGWGQFIFASASEVVNNVKQRDMVMAIPKLRAEAEAKYGAPKAPKLKAITPAVAVHSPPEEPKPKNVSPISLNDRLTPARSPSPLATNGSSAPSSIATMTPPPSIKTELNGYSNSSAGTSPSPSVNGDVTGSPRAKSKTPGSASKARKRK